MSTSKLTGGPVAYAANEALDAVYNKLQELDKQLEQQAQAVHNAFGVIMDARKSVDLLYKQRQELAEQLGRLAPADWQPKHERDRIVADAASASYATAPTQPLPQPPMKARGWGAPSSPYAAPYVPQMRFSRPHPFPQNNMGVLGESAATKRSDSGYDF